MAAPARHPLLGRLAPLVGEWTVSVLLGDMRLTGGRATFDWLEDGAFLRQRADADPPGPDVPAEWVANSPLPTTMVIGLDEAAERFWALYADARGVCRVYQMSMDGPRWRIWRDAPGFCQRFTATRSADGRRIDGRWEKSTDGEAWEHDFDLAYARVG